MILGKQAFTMEFRCTYDNTTLMAPSHRVVIMLKYFLEDHKFYTYFVGTVYHDNIAIHFQTNSNMMLVNVIIIVYI